MRYNKSILALFAFAFTILLVTSSCGSGKGCDCPHFGSVKTTQNSNA